MTDENHKSPDALDDDLLDQATGGQQHAQQQGRVLTDADFNSAADRRDGAASLTTEDRRTEQRPGVIAKKLGMTRLF